MRFAFWFGIQLSIKSQIVISQPKPHLKIIVLNVVKCMNAFIGNGHHWKKKSSHNIWQCSMHTVKHAHRHNCDSTYNQILYGIVNTIKKCEWLAVTRWQYTIQNAFTPDQSSNVHRSCVSYFDTTHSLF